MEEVEDSVSETVPNGEMDTDREIEADSKTLEVEDKVGDQEIKAITDSVLNPKSDFDKREIVLN